MIETEEKQEMSNDAYHAETDYIGKSGLDLIRRSPLHFWERYLNPNRVREPETPAQIFGSLVHCAVLEAHKLETRYASIPEDMNKRTTAWKDFQAEHVGKKLVSVEMYAQALAIREAVFAHPYAANLLSVGVAEKSMWANDPVTGVRVKSKPDFHNTKLDFLVDLKTTLDAGEERFARDSFNYRYHVQDAFYTDVADWAGVPIKGFAFIAVEKEPPYAVSVYVLDDDSRELGRLTYREDLNTYAKCYSAQKWHGYHENNVTSLRLPNWAFRKI